MMWDGTKTTVLVTLVTINIGGGIFGVENRRESERETTNDDVHHSYRTIRRDGRIWQDEFLKNRHTSV